MTLTTFCEKVTLSCLYHVTWNMELMHRLELYALVFVARHWLNYLLNTVRSAWPGDVLQHVVNLSVLVLSLLKRLWNEFLRVLLLGNQSDLDSESTPAVLRGKLKGCLEFKANFRAWNQIWKSNKQKVSLDSRTTSLLTPVIVSTQTFINSLGPLQCRSKINNWIKQFILRFIYFRI